MAKKNKPAKWDYEGWATRYNVKCADGETIAHSAFEAMDGVTVPLVDDHARGYDCYLDAIIGNAYLEHRDEGVYAYLTFNTKYDKALRRKEQVEHGDIQKLSIKANMLKRVAGAISYGVIRDLSIVAAGANPGAFIQQAQLVHGDGYCEDLEDEAYICFNDDVSESIEHADPEPEDGKTKKADPDLATVYASMNDDQKAATMLLLASVMAGEDETSDKDPEDNPDDSIDHSADENSGTDDQQEDDQGTDPSEINHSDNGGKQHMKAKDFEHNDQGTGSGAEERPYVAVADFMDTVRHGGSFSAACIQHGIENVTDLYDDAKAVNPEPLIINSPQGWVKSVLGGVKKVPFTKIKSLWTDLSAFEGNHRAHGYPVLGEQKTEEEITMLNRITEPGWMYKLQKVDRDVLYQITSFNFIQWLQAEMGMMLNQELARAALISDGRTASDRFKIKEDRIRPIAFDTSVWTIQETLAAGAKGDDVLDTLLELRSDYMGSGDPSLFVAPQMVSGWLTAKDTTGRRIYKNVQEIAGLLRVKEIVEVPPMAVAVNPAGNAVKSIMVNMADYALSLPTGDSALKDTKFDLEYNQENYLLEWLAGGALITPKSAIVLSQPIPAT